MLIKDIDPKDFAIAVVASSDQTLSVQEKLDLYREAYDAAEDKIFRTKEPLPRLKPIKK